MSLEKETVHEKDTAARSEIGHRACWAQDRGIPDLSEVAQRLNSLPPKYVSPDATNEKPGSTIIVVIPDRKAGETLIAPIRPPKNGLISQGLVRVATELSNIYSCDSVTVVTQGNLGEKEMPHPYIALNTGKAKIPDLTAMQLDQIDELVANLDESGEFNI